MRGDERLRHELGEVQRVELLVRLAEAARIVDEHRPTAHGFEERLTTDIYPSDFSWTPDFLRGPEYRPTGVSMRPIVEAGPCVRSLQIDYDDDVEHCAVRKLYDLARSAEDRPFFLTVSFTHPHPPFVTGEAHWNRYRHDEIDMPSVL